MKNTVSSKGAGHIYSGLKNNEGNIKRGYRILAANELLIAHFNNYVKQMYSILSNYNYKPAIKAGIVAEGYISHVALRHKKLLMSSTTSEELNNFSFSDNPIDKVELIELIEEARTN
jgi:hypothetical protein